PSLGRCPHPDPLPEGEGEEATIPLPEGEGEEATIPLPEGEGEDDVERGRSGAAACSSPRLTARRARARAAAGPGRLPGGRAAACCAACGSRCRGWSRHGYGCRGNAAASR